MQINKDEYNMILRIIQELEVLKDVAEREFNDYCMNISHCGDCALPKHHYMECTAENYFILKDKGEI